MHFHATVVLTAYADTREELVQELVLHCQHLPAKLAESLDEWNEKATGPRDGLQWHCDAYAGRVVGEFLAHADPTDHEEN